MIPLCILRPEPGNAATCAAARTLGLDVVSAPIFATGPLPWTPVAPDGFAGLLIGSAAVLRHGGAGLNDLTALPVHAVGASTAQAARAAGFAVATTGTGGLQAVAADLAPGRYLRLHGQAHVALQPPPGVAIIDVPVYAARPVAPPPALLATLAAGPVVVALHSGEAARHFAGLCAAHGVTRAHVALACLAPRIAQAAGDGWKMAKVSSRATDEALLSLAQQMCQTV